MPLSHRENFLRNVSFQTPEWIPSGVSMSGATWEQLGPELEDVILRHPVMFPGYKKGDHKFTAREDAPIWRRAGDQFTDAWGCVWQREIDGLEGIVIKNPLDDWSKFEAYKAPDPLLQGDRGPVNWDETRKHVADAKRKGGLTSGGTVHGFLFMRLYYIRGFENLMLDMGSNDPRLQKLIDMIVDHTLKIINEYIAMGVDVMNFADDLGTQTASMISPKMFRKWITPAYKKVMQPCRKAGMHVGIHTDGHMVELTDELIDAGVTITNPQDLCNGIDEIAKAMKGRVCVRMDIDRQTVIPFGTRKEIRDLVEEEVRKIGSPRGGLEFIAGIYPPTPPENIDALCSALEEFRTYWWDGRGR
jgi:hypothetical protein